MVTHNQHQSDLRLKREEELRLQHEAAVHSAPFGRCRSIPFQMRAQLTAQPSICQHANCTFAAPIQVQQWLSWAQGCRGRSRALPAAGGFQVTEAGISFSLRNWMEITPALSLSFPQNNPSTPAHHSPPPWGFRERVGLGYWTPTARNQPPP